MKAALLVAFMIANYVPCAFANQVVSIYQVLGNPADFNDKIVTLTGVLGVLDGDIVGLFPDLESRNSEITVNSIVLSGGHTNGAVGKFGKDEVQKLDGKYVTVRGTYHYTTPRNWLYSGGISDVTSLHVAQKIPAYSTQAPKD